MALTAAELADAHAIIVAAENRVLDAFPAARALGYRGISSKSCKGLYKSIINATRAPSGENATDVICPAWARKTWLVPVSTFHR